MIRPEQLEQLSRLLEGELSPGEAEQLEAELRAQPELAEARRQMGAIASASRELPVDLPESRAAALVAGAMAMQPPRKSWPRQFALGTAALVLLCAAATWIALRAPGPARLQSIEGPVTLDGQLIEGPELPLAHDALIATGPLASVTLHCPSGDARLAANTQLHLRGAKDCAELSLRQGVAVLDASAPMHLALPGARALAQGHSFAAVEPPEVLARVTPMLAANTSGDPDMNALFAKLHLPAALLAGAAAASFNVVDGHAQVSAAQAAPLALAAGQSWRSSGPAALHPAGQGSSALALARNDPEGPSTSQPAALAPGKRLAQAELTDNTLVPGVGLRGVVVGKSTLEDALSVFGSDGQVIELPSGAVVNYIVSAEGAPQLNLPANRARPSSLTFSNGALALMIVTGEQTELHTPGGNRVGSTREQLLAEFGEGFFKLKPGETLPGPALPPEVESCFYADLGFGFLIDRATGKSTAFIISEPQKMRTEQVEREVAAAAQQPIAPTAENTMIPGTGIAGLVIGKSTIDDVVRIYGKDVKLSGDVARSCLLFYGGHLPPRGTRPWYATPPMTFELHQGILEVVSAIPGGSSLVTPRGTPLVSRIEVLRAEFGDDYELRTRTIPVAASPATPLVVDTYIYWRLGVRVKVDREKGTPIEVALFPPSQEPRPAAPAPADLIWTPGEGIHGLALGKSTPDDVLAAYGKHHARIEYNQKTGRVAKIFYGYNAKFFDGGEGITQRPYSFTFHHGVLSVIHVSNGDTALKSSTGLGSGATRADFEKIYGPAQEKKLDPEKEKEQKEAAEARASWAAHGDDLAKEMLAVEPLSVELEYPAQGMTLRMNSDTRVITSIWLRLPQK